MGDAIVWPTWAVWAVTVGAPLGSVLGVFLANWVARREAVEIETRSKREETMQTLRWAAELAIDRDPRRAALGLGQLRALGDADMLDDEQQGFVTAALEAVVAKPQSEIDEAEQSGVDVVVEIAEEGGGADTVTYTGDAVGTAPALPSSPTVEREADTHG